MKPLVFLDSILILLPLAFLAVLIFLDEATIVVYLSFLCDEVLRSYLIDLGEYRVRLLLVVLSKKYGISGRSQVLVL